MNKQQWADDAKALIEAMSDDEFYSFLDKCDPNRTLVETSFDQIKYLTLVPISELADMGVFSSDSLGLAA